MPSPLDDPTLCALGHLNYIEFSRELARSTGSDGHVVEEGGLVLFASASGFPVLFNGAWRTDPTLPAADAIARANQFFAAKGHGWSLTLREDDPDNDDLRAAAEAAGLVVLLRAPEMVRRTPVDERAPREGAVLRWVDDPRTFDDFVAVSDSAYASIGMPVGTVADAITDQRALTAPNVHTVVAYLDDAPVAAAQVILSHSIAGVYWVGTIEAGRGTGLGDAVTRAVTNRAFDEGSRAVTLQASPMGEPIYQKMGYETLYHYSTYVCLDPPAS